MGIVPEWGQYDVRVFGWERGPIMVRSDRLLDGEGDGWTRGSIDWLTVSWG